MDEEVESAPVDPPAEIPFGYRPPNSPNAYSDRTVLLEEARNPWRLPRQLLYVLCIGGGGIPLYFNVIGLLARSMGVTTSSSAGKETSEILVDLVINLAALVRINARVHARAHTHTHTPTHTHTHTRTRTRTHTRTHAHTSPSPPQAFGVVSWLGESRRRESSLASISMDEEGTFGQLKREDDERMRQLGLKGGLFDSDESANGDRP